MLLGWLPSFNAQSSGQPLLPEGVVELPELQPQGLGQRPTRAVASHGLELAVDTRWADGYGYQPIKFHFQLSNAASGDHSIAIRFYVIDRADQPPDLSVEQHGLIRAGEKSATITVRAPQYESWNLVSWDIFVDGTKEPLLSLEQSRPLNVHHWQQGGLSLYYPRFGAGATTRWMNTSIGNTFGRLQFNRSTGPMSSNWLDLTCFDCVVMLYDEFIAATEKHPNEMQALRRWVAAGGSLWIENTGLSTERLKVIDERLNLQEFISPPPRDEESTELPANWSYVRATPPTNTSGNSPQTESEPALDEALEPAFPPQEFRFGQSTTPPQTDSHNWLAERPANLGHVTAFVGKWNDFNDDSQRALRGLVRERWIQRSWPMRHGFAPNVPTLDFSNFLIPGVGLAPVIEFRVLITIFVLLIGPLNYWVLSRAKRLYLLVLTVPLGAAAVTMLLFSYAFLADGFDTQVRTRSITMLDQPAGEAVTWARQSYYAGFAPAEGLLFPADTAVYPILSGTAGFRGRSRSQEREIEWTDGEQVFTNGWLASRTPTQFLAIRSHEAEEQIEVRAAAGRCQVTNRLGVPLTWLLLIDDDKKIWHETDIESEERVALKSSDPVEALRVIREALIANRPQLPEELRELANAARQAQQNGRRGRYGMNRFSHEAPEYHLYSSAMERRFEALAEALGGGATGELPPRTYVAVTSTSIDLPIGLTHADEVDGFHVIIGRW